MIDAVAASHNGYSWQFEKGVLHVFERSLVSDSRNPLNVVVDKVPEDPVTVACADNYLFETIRKVVRPNGTPEIDGNLIDYSTEQHFRIQTDNDPVRKS